MSSIQTIHLIILIREENHLFMEHFNPEFIYVITLDIFANKNRFQLLKK